MNFVRIKLHSIFYLYMKHYTIFIAFMYALYINDTIYSFLKIDDIFVE